MAKSNRSNDNNKPDKQTTKPKIEGGKGKMNPSTGKKFSKDYQPDPKKISEGVKRHFALRDMLNLVTGQKFDGSTKVYRDLCAAYLGIDKKDVTVRMIMDFRQIEKAILKGDTLAYKVIMDRSFGKPREEQAPIVDIPQDDGEKTVFKLPGGIDFEI